MTRAITIGSAMVDIIVLVADRDVERMTMHNATSSFLLLEQGRKIESLSITDHSGGGAVNAAVSMARLGLEVATLIKIGLDRDGERILNRLAREGIDASAVVTTDELPTGVAVMVCSHDKNATIFTQRGSNTLLRPEDLRDDMFEGRDLVYVTNLSNRSADCFPTIVDHGRNAGAFVAVNPGIRQLTSRSRALLDCFPKIDLLAINRVEAEALVPVVCASCADHVLDEPDDPGLPPLCRVGLEFGGFAMGLVSFMRHVRSLGVGRLVVTDGIDGAYLADDDGIHYCPTVRTEVQGTAGAGDAFISTLSVFLAEDRPADETLRAATINAAAVVGAIDAQTGLLQREMLAERAGGATLDLPVSRIA
ncbi:MAG: carbohydrate kinase family protein [Rhodospirillales bacterium]